MKILAVASAGGHWNQLIRLQPAFEGHELAYATTKPDFGSMVNGHMCYEIPDSNRKDKLGLLRSFYHVFLLIRKLKPHLVITTGAAPGLMAILVGRIFGMKTVWIDSIANAERLSLSGRLAVYIATRVYTQWEDLSNSKVFFKGNILG